MVKTGSARVKKFIAKHDVDVIMLRWKALRQYSLVLFSGVASTSEMQDQLIAELIKLFQIPYGKAGNAYTKLKKLLYHWDLLTPDQKAFLKQDWINEELPVEVFDQIDTYVSNFYALTEVEKLRTGFLYAFLNYYPKPLLEVPEDTTSIEETIQKLLAYALNDLSWGVMSNDLDVVFQKNERENIIENPLLSIEDLNVVLEPKISKIANTCAVYDKTVPNPTCKLENLDFEPSLNVSLLVSDPLKGLVKELRVSGILLVQQTLWEKRARTSAPLRNVFMNPSILISLGAILGIESIKIGYFTRFTSGEQIINDVGFKPKIIIFHAVGGGGVHQMFCDGFSDAVKHHCLYSRGGSVEMAVTQDNCIFIELDSETHASAIVTSMNNDGFTLFWVNPSELNIDGIYLAMK